MKKIITIIFPVLFILNLSYSQSDQPEAIDASLKWLNNNYVESSEDFHEKALQTLGRVYQLKDTQLMAETHLVLMRWHAFHVPFTIDSVPLHGEKAIALFKKTNDQAKLAATCVELAFESIDGNQLDKAEKLIFDSIKIYEALEDEKGLGSAYSTLSRIFLSQKEPELAIKYGLEALKLTEKVRDYNTTQETWLALVLAYHEAGELDKAINAADKCIETITIYNIDDEFNLARAYGFRGDVWSDLKDYQKSLEDNLKSYAIVEAKIGAARPAAKTYRQGIGLAYYMKGDYKEALPHLEAAIDGYVNLGQGSQPKMQKIYNEVADCYAQLGDYQKAYQSEQLAHGVYETLMQDKVANLEAEALIKYETVKKDEALASQAALIEQKSKTQTLIIMGTSLLIVFLIFLLYFFYKNKKATKIIRAKNAENELLLKEIHHRVKNNLEMVKSLIALQSAQIEDPATKEALIASQNRVQSMGIIHQKLYQGTNLGSIEMKDYFINLSEGILDTFDAEEQVKIECAMDNLDLDVDTAVPIGLIVNELLTNALKYAFPKKEQGTIHISLEKMPDNYLRLKVNDNGIGKTAGIAPIGTGFGSQLVQLLTQQLNGKMKEYTNEGTHIEFDFLIEQSA
ncbi:histidine kinase dimerization/phosphoacceptor domain -containing protein [Aquiflexum sp.]|uniref:tetratricopeptide repeat-containing sensor histidine kinase n=1 Tax=Aquiflexum sp. TaxID=1872584 RepID=UPI003593D1B6